MTPRVARSGPRVARSGGRLTAALLSVLLLITGCGFGGLYDTPLPGGADVGDSPYRVVAHFTNVLDLVPQSGVRVNDVAVGRVEEIDLADDGRTAVVTLLVNGSVRLPPNAVARLRQSSVLGEKFVELAPPPAEAAPGRLAEGAVIPVSRTNRNTEIEEVLGALSLMLNGGGINQLKDINTELNAALGGKSREIKSYLRNLKTFLASFARNKGEIIRALNATDKLAATLAGRKEKIATLIDELGPGIEVLAEQRGDLVKMLKSLDALSDVAVDTVDRSKANLVEDLRLLEPTLRNLTKAGSDFPRAMEMLLTFPFPDEALKAIKGDYLNMYLKLDTRTGGR